MKKNLLKKLLATITLPLVLFSCSMGFNDNPLAVSLDVIPLLSRSAVESMSFTGGYAVYNPENEAGSHIINGAKIATRLGKVHRVDLGDGSAYFQVDESKQVYGFITVDSVSKDEITFTYYQFSGDKNEKNAQKIGTHTLGKFQSCDLDGDGIPDIGWTVPPFRRKGFEKAMYLQTLSDPDRQNTTMIAIIPLQYARSCYPGGLMAVNPYGQFIVNKYDVGSANRAAITSVSNGDYVFDAQTGLYGKYEGKEVFNRSGISIDDANIKSLEVSSSAGDSAFFFSQEEFTEGKSPKELLEKIGKIAAAEDWTKYSEAEQIVYLNKLLREDYFAKNVLAGGNVKEEFAPEDMNAINNPGVIGKDLIMFNRLFLSVAFPDDCPIFNTNTTVLAGIFPLLSCNLTPDAPKQKPSDDAEFRATYKVDIADKKYEEDVAEIIGDYNPDECEPEFYEHIKKRAQILNYFDQNTLFSIDVLGIGLDEIDNSVLKKIVAGLDAKAQIGVGGNFNISFSNVEVGVKMYILLDMGVKNKLSISVKKTSLLKQTNEITKAGGTVAKNQDDQIEYINEAVSEGKLSEDDIKEQLEGLDKRLENDVSKPLRMLFGIGEEKPSGKKLFDVNQNFAVGVVPMFIGLEGRFDLLFSASVIGAFDNFYCGATMLAGVEGKAGMNYGVEWENKGWRFFPIYIPSFHCSPYADGGAVFESTCYLGKVKKDKDVALGFGGKVSITPMLTFIPRIGIGTSSNALRCGADLEAPINIGVRGTASLILFPSLDSNKNLTINEKFNLDVNAFFDAGLQIGLFLKGDILGCEFGKEYKTNKYTIFDYEWPLFNLATENGEIKYINKDLFKTIDNTKISL